MSHWVVTGGNRGIGFAIVKELLSLGEKVTVGSRKKPEIIHGNMGYLQLDVANIDSIIEFSKKVEPVDVLINNAGVLIRDNFPEVKEDEALYTVKVNTFGSLFVVQELYKQGKFSKNVKILNISSTAGSISTISGTNSIAYSVSKAALNMVTKVLSNILSDYVVVSIHPGWVKTDMGGPLAPVLAEESAKGIIKLALSLKHEHSGRFFDYTGAEMRW